MKQHPTKKQHYIPQVYLKGFSTDERKINTYWLDNSGIADERCIPIESICRENYLYEVRNDSNEIIHVNHIEKRLSALEGKFSEYRRILLHKAFIKDNCKTKCFFTLQEKTFWKLYIAIQMLRMPKVLSEAKSFSREFFGKSLSKNLANNIAIEQCLPFFKEANPEEKNCLFSLIEPMQEMSLVLGVDNKCRVITSDNPAYAYSPDKSILHFEKVIFPISDQLVIFLFGGNLKEMYDNNRLFIMNDEDVDAVMKSTAYSAEKMIFAKNPLSRKDKQLIISARKDRVLDRNLQS